MVVATPCLKDLFKRSQIKNKNNFGLHHIERFPAKFNQLFKGAVVAVGDWAPERRGVG